MYRQSQYDMKGMSVRAEGLRERAWGRGGRTDIGAPARGAPVSVPHRSRVAADDPYSVLTFLTPSAVLRSQYASNFRFR